MEPIVNENFLLPTVALRGLVVFPEMVLHFDIGRKKSISAVKNAMLHKQPLFLVTQTDLSEEVHGRENLFSVGVVCEIKQLVRLPSGEYFRVVVEGQYRAELLNLVEEKPHFVAELRPLTTTNMRGMPELDAQAMARYAFSLLETYASVQQKIANDILAGAAKQKSLGKLADYIAGNLPLEFSDKQSILEERNAPKRLEKLCVILAREIELLDAMEQIEARVQDQMDENQREYYLREQLKAISQELGEGDTAVAEAERYRAKILELHLDADSEEKLLQECDRMARMQPTSPESAVSRAYLDTVLSLPWHTYTKDNLQFDHARRILHRDHYGLEEVKERILELIAVRRLSPDVKGQILCLVGPPGVGKTSIAKSLAKAMHRKYARIALGGVHDEAEIRGHRKTYIGSMPGNIVTALTRAGTMNPLILLDEIDKLSGDYKGDPASALLETLDPEQNNTFRDHYLEIPLDLSKVLFVTTANDLSAIPAPLLDRMEVISLSGYTAEEKLQIAKRHLVQKQRKENGLTGQQLRITEDALRLMIDGYTREAGVRQLERVIAKVMRKAAMRIAEGGTGRMTVHAGDLHTLLGVRRYKSADLPSADAVGVVNGLAWTSVGGEMLTVETLVMEGTGKLELTGSLGDVMQESAKAAVSFCRANAEKFGIDASFYKTKDIHIHFPEGAVPKDGPSAGVTVTTALVSALSGRPVRKDAAMTGEITLTGRVLPIGGLREKSMAAYIHKMHTVFIPAENTPDLEKVDATVREGLHFVPVETVFEILDAVLTSPASTVQSLQPPEAELPLLQQTSHRNAELC